LAIVIGVGTAARIPATARGASANKPLPEFSEIQKIAERHFKAKGLEPGDILARSEVEPLLSLLKTAGWTVPDYKGVVNAVLKDSSFLVQSLRTEKGRKFARQITKDPRGYDRLDRLAAMPHGRQTVRDLIHGPDGDKLIKYLTTTGGGTALGQMLSNAPTGKHFNEPTGRIYTTDQLIDVLEQKYAETLAKEQKTSGK
jgi:hypothetical protein